MLSLTLLLLGATLASSQKVVSWDIQRRAVPGNTSKVKRATITEALGNEQNLYYANVTVGTPGQLLQLQLDTGSSDVWMTETEADYCLEQEGNCIGGTFDPLQSSSYNVVDAGGFAIQYVDNSASQGDYFTDTLSIGGISLEKQQMGLAIETTIGTGIIGVGFTENEAVCRSTTSCDTYPTIIDQMVKQKKINSKAYSLWLNDLSENTGSILFGGVDTKKYMGDLVTLPILPNANSGSTSTFSVAWTGFVITTPDGPKTNFVSSDFVEPVVLDSGTTDMILPDDLAEQLYVQFGAQPFSSKAGYVAPCFLRTSNATLDFTFGGKGGPTIRVEINEFLLDLPTTTGRPIQDDNGHDICLLGFEGAQGRPILFGDSFLRSAYVVYDLDNKEISIAQTIMGVDDSDVEEIKSGPRGVPNVASTASARAPEQTLSDARGFAVTAQATDTASPTSVDEDGNPPLAAYTTAAYKEGSTDGGLGGDNEDAAAALKVPRVGGYEGLVIWGLMSVFVLVGSGMVML